MPNRAVLKLYKKVGETPLECLARFRKSHPAYKNEKMTYAGRLDPMAEGVLLVLVGEECKKKEKYLNLDKEYEIDILFGFATDTYDILGLVRKQSARIFSPFNGVPNHSEKILADCFVKKFKQAYPPYSSKFWEKARAGTLIEKEIETKMVEIYKIKLLKIKNISKKSLINYIIKTIGKVKGDFRQKQILAKWGKILQKSKQKKFQVISLKVKCSSGTYMRSLAHNIGNEVQVPTSILRIKRTIIYQ